MLDMLDTLIPTAILDITASVRLMLSLRPRLIPIFCMEVMVMAMLVTLAMLDTMDTPMLDMPTMDKPIIIIVFFFSDHKFQCLTSFLVTEGRKHRESKCLNKDTACIDFVLLIALSNLSKSFVLR